MTANSCDVGAPAASVIRRASANRVALLTRVVTAEQMECSPSRVSGK